MGWSVSSKKNDGNIEFNIENGNIDSKNGVKRGPRGLKRGHSIPYHHQQGAPHPHPTGTPFDPFFDRFCD